jgi:hypothetical protein
MNPMTELFTGELHVEVFGLANDDFTDLKERIKEAAAAHKALVVINGRKHPADLPSSFRREARITVTCALEDRTYDEPDRPHHFANIEDALDEVTSMGWHELNDGRVLCHEEDEDHFELGPRIGIVNQDGPHQQGCPCWSCTYE